MRPHPAFSASPRQAESRVSGAAGATRADRPVVGRRPAALTAQSAEEDRSRPGATDQGVRPSGADSGAGWPARADHDLVGLARHHGHDGALVGAGAPATSAGQAATGTVAPAAARAPRLHEDARDPGGRAPRPALNELPESVEADARAFRRDGPRRPRGRRRTCGSCRARGARRARRSRGAGRAGRAHRPSWPRRPGRPGRARRPRRPRRATPAVADEADLELGLVARPGVLLAVERHPDPGGVRQEHDAVVLERAIEPVPDEVGQVNQDEGVPIARRHRDPDDLVAPRRRRVRPGDRALRPAALHGVDVEHPALRHAVDPQAEESTPDVRAARAGGKCRKVEAEIDPGGDGARALEQKRRGAPEVLRPLRRRCVGVVGQGGQRRARRRHAGGDEGQEHGAREQGRAAAPDPHESDGHASSGDTPRVQGAVRFDGSLAAGYRERRRARKGPATGAHERARGVLTIRRRRERPGRRPGAQAG